jgi:hypothetical protein
MSNKDVSQKFLDISETSKPPPKELTSLNKFPFEFILKTMFSLDLDLHAYE